MPEQLKIIIDADVQRAVAGVKDVSKVISLDFAKATQTASSAAFDLSKSVNDATTRINASIDKMVDEALGGANKLKSSFGDFGAVNLDSSQVQAAIEQLRTRLSSLQASIPITVTSEGLQKLSADIAKTKADLNSLIGKNIKVDVDATAALQKVGLLKSQLSTLSNVPFKFDTSNAIKSLTGLQDQVKQLDSALKTTSGLNAFQSALGRSTAAVDRLQKTGAGLNSFYSNFTSLNNKAAASLGSLPNYSKAASAAIFNFGNTIQGAQFGVLNIVNTIDPLIKSLQAASVASKAAGVSMTSGLTAALTGPAGIGLAISAVSTLLVIFGDKLFGASKSLSAAEIEASKFAASLNDIKVGIDDFFSRLDFETNLQKLTNKLKLGDAAEVFNIGLDKKTADDIVNDTNEQITKASLRISQLITNGARTLSKDGQKLATAFFSALQTGTVVPDDLIDKLSKADQKVFQILNTQATRIGALTEQNTKARRKSAESDVQIELQKAEDLKKALEKQKDAFEKFQNETIAKAKQFAKQFGAAFITPDLEESFFVDKNEIFKRAQTLLNNVKTGNLIIKLPVKPEIEFLPVTDGISQSTIDNFFSGLGKELKIPIEVIPDFTLSKGNLDAIDKKLDLRKQFSILGDLGLKEFNKIDFSNINSGISEATKRLEGMMAIATTLNQAIGQGLSNAFNSVFDAVLEGKNVFKALANSVKELIATTIKAVAQMLILRLVTNAIFPGAGAAGGGVGRLLGGIGGAANFGFSSGIGSRAFSNVITVNVNGQISGDTILLAGQRAANSQGRFGG